MSIGSFADIEQRQQNVDSLKRELDELDITIEKQKEERDYISGLFRTYKRDIENNPYEEMERQLEADQQEQQAEQERQKWCSNCNALTVERVTYDSGEVKNICSECGEIFKLDKLVQIAVAVPSMADIIKNQKDNDDNAETENGGNI